MGVRVLPKAESVLLKAWHYLLARKSPAAAAFALLLLLSCAANAQNTISSVSTGEPTQAIAVNPTQNIIYITRVDNTLTYIDGATNTVHQISDPGAANTNGAFAIVTYLNGVFVANSISNDIVSYYVPPGNGYQFQQLFKDPNAVQPVAMVNNPNGYGSLYVANKGSNSVSVFVNNGNGLAFATAIPVGQQPVGIVVSIAAYTLASSTTCAANTTLAPTQSCSITINFNPTKSGLQAGAVNISDNTLFGQEVILLTGTGSK